MFSKVSMSWKLVRVLGLAGLAGPISAGSGTFTNGVYNFCVSVRFKATDDQLTKIRDAFQKGSDMFADATDGKQRFGNVRIANESGCTNEAEFWINSGYSGAYATYGKYGVRGEHIVLFYGSGAEFQASSNPVAIAPLLVPFTIAHEFAHHTFGLADEYFGPPGHTAAMCATAAAEALDLNYCLMDNYKVRGGMKAAPQKVTLKEFCVKANHDTTSKTQQTARNKQSCWETVAAHPKRSAAAPAGLPNAAAPGSQAVQFANVGGAIIVPVTVDRSGSMADEGRIVFAKAGAAGIVAILRLLSLFRQNDAVGIVSFAANSSVDFAVSPVGAPGNATGAATAINALMPSGMTNIGGALATALAQITAQATRSCHEFIVLLTDGEHNVGTDPATVIPMLQKEQVAVITVGIGSDLTVAAEMALRKIASDTGGVYFRLNDPFAVVLLMVSTAVINAGFSVGAIDPETLLSGQTREIPLFVEDGAESIIATLAVKDGNDDIQLTLQDPSGATLTKDSPAAKSSSAGSQVQILQVDLPAPGAWKVRITAGKVTNGGFDAMAFVQHEGVDLSASVENDAVSFPDAIQISATPTFDGVRVIGANVSGVVTRPDGSQQAIVLFDDGSPGHGDDVADDGIYSARFTGYTRDGTYTFDLKAENSTGSAYPGEVFPGDVPPPPKAVPPFVRMAKASAILTGMPSFRPADVNADGKVDCQDVQIVRAAFGKSCGQPGFDSRADVNNDCVVGVADLNYVLSKVPAGLSCTQ